MGLGKMESRSELDEKPDELTLRDRFAMAALTGLLAAPDDVGVDARLHIEKAAEWAYQQADAMLKARAGWD